MTKKDNHATMPRPWVAALAIGVAAWGGTFPRRYAFVAYAASVIFAFGGLATGLHGFFALFGPMMMIAFGTSMVWVLVTSAVVWAGASAGTPTTAASEASTAAVPT